MKRVVVIICFIALSFPLLSQNKKSWLNGYDGGMMLHVGYLNQVITPLDMETKGVTKGIGGAIKFHFGEHFRLGTEGYTSSMSLLNNGSYIDTFWAGLLGDFYTIKGRYMPYIGLTVGGGAVTSFLMLDGEKKDWSSERNTVFNKTPFVAIDPYIGCDYIVSKAFHLTLKLDFLTGFGGSNLYLPKGARAYIGFIFFH